MADASRGVQEARAEGGPTGGIAHDLNNHLTSVLGALSLMERRIEQGRTAELPHLISVASAAVRRAAALSQRLLAPVRHRPPALMLVDVNGLVSSLDDLLRLTLGPAIALETAAGTEVWSVLCDPGQFEDAMLNLAINARDAMPDGGRLIVRIDNLHLDHALALPGSGTVGPGDFIVLGFTDTGTGMAPEVIERLFEPFFTTKPPGKGTGLGLPMVQDFVERCGGHLAVRSELGQGTTIRIYLPRYRAETAAAADAGL